LPELPEVETIKQTLASKLTGRSITGIVLFHAGAIVHPSPEEFADRIRESRVLGLRRRGKYLLIDLSSGQTLVIHFRMTGRLVFHSQPATAAPHTRLIIELDGGGQLHFVDSRKFGRLWLWPTAALDGNGPVARLGREPLEDGFTREFLRLELSRRRGKIKPLLLDQTFIAGLGNIYVDEALHLAPLHPEPPASDLSPAEIARLHRAIGRVLQDGIDHHGTTLRDYRDGTDAAGRHQEYLRVHRQKACPVCGTAIRRKRVAGRGTHFCPFCQKEEAEGMEHGE